MFPYWYLPSSSKSEQYDPDSEFHISSILSPTPALSAINQQKQKRYQENCNCRQKRGSMADLNNFVPNGFDEYISRIMKRSRHYELKI